MGARAIFSASRSGARLHPVLLAPELRIWQTEKMRRAFGLATVSLAFFAGCGGRAASDVSSAGGSADGPTRSGGLPSPAGASGGGSALSPPAQSGGTAPPVSTGGAEGMGAPPAIPMTEPPDMIPPVAGNGGAASDPAGMGGSDQPSGSDECEPLRALNPNDVYVLGTLIEGQAQFDALAHWSDPNRALVGFPGGLDEESAVIHPLDGTLFYMESYGGNYRFQTGRCLRRGDPLPGYPEPGDNHDPIVPFPCEERPYGRTLLINPQGAIAVDCVGSWRDLEGGILYEGQLQVLSYGSLGRLLTRQGLFSIEEGVLHPFVGLPDLAEHYPLAWRAVEDGFWVVLAGADATFDRQLWFVDVSGAAEIVGDYAPSGMVPGFGGIAIAGDGTLFETAHAAGVINDYIQRRTFTSAELVYDEAGDPLVKLHASRLVTAP